MAAPSSARLRAFVREHTHLAEVTDLPGVRIHTTDDVIDLCRQVGTQLGQPDPDLPYWAFPWAGGLAVARHLVDHPGEVAGKRVLDVGSGSGLCAIVALRMGAASADALDIDPLSEAAVWLNSRANSVHVGFVRTDLLDGPPPLYEVILAGDVFYQEGMAVRIQPWLRVAAEHGTRVLIGDPGRTYLPRGLELVGTYRVRTSRELETAQVTESAVYTIPRAG